MRVRFKCKKAREFLKRHGYVYTVRNYCIKGWLEVHFVGLGKGELIAIDYVRSKKDLEPFVEESGFESTDEWWHWIRKLNGYNNVYYLYLAKLYRKENQTLDKFIG